MKLLVHQLVTTSLIAFQLRPVKGFTNPTSKKRIIQSPSSYRRLDHCLSNPSHFLTGVGHLNQANQSSGDDLNDLRDDIQEMRRQALDRLNVLDEKLSSDEVQDGQRADTIKDQSKEFAESVAVSNDPSIVSLASRPFPDVSPKRDELSLLDGTCWKLSLNIGREQGTWMPKTWGESGSRLLLNLDVDFSSSQLYEREEFLGGIGGAKILQVNNNELTVAPTITQGSRQLRAIDGGWRVAKGQGPMGTDILKFYIEVEEEISRKGGDVYCPAGRIYCSCGYFSFIRPRNGYKEQIRKELDNMIVRAEQLDVEILEAGPFNKIKKNAEMIRLKVDMQQAAERFAGASVSEPDKSLLKFSSDGTVGLTREGGVCCKVQKGLGIEYHILGRFSCQNKST